MKRNTPEVFWGRVDKSGGPSACHPYTGRLKPPTKANPIGHGMYDHDGTWDYAHRYAWFLTYGTWPEPECLHHCDNPPCCNVKHLYAGTQAQNIRDREARHRRNAPKGEASALAKLTEADVTYIRANYIRRSRGPFNLTGLAKRFNVDHTTIHHVLTGQSWKEAP